MLCVDKAGQASVGGQLKRLLKFGNEECICMAVEGAVASWISIPASLGFHLAIRVYSNNEHIVTRISAWTVVMV